MSRFKPVGVELSAEQQAEADHVFQRIRGPFEENAPRLANLMASVDVPRRGCQGAILHAARRELSENW